MPLFTPKKTVDNWYKYDISFSLELIDSFIKQIESQVDETVIRFEKEKETFVFEEIPEEGVVQTDSVFQGLDNETWDLEGVFANYFPNLQRRSALLTLVGFFEHELDKLCLLYRVEKSFTLSLSDLTGKGIDRSTRYLEKVAGIDVHKSSSEWNEIKLIQQVRNIIVHQDGKLTDQNGTPLKAVIDYINQTSSLNGEDEVIIMKGYLAHVAAIFITYFQLIASSILSKENT